MNHYKVVLLGSTHAGKTSIIQRFVNNTFAVTTFASVQSAFFERMITISSDSGNVDVTLDIWDTAGQERFHSLTPMYYRDAKASLIVFDVTDANSFSKCKQWVNELRAAQGDKTVLMIVGNKYDLKSIRVVRTEEAQKYASSVGITYMETSAKTGFQVDELFTHISHEIFYSNNKENTMAAGSDVNIGGQTGDKARCC